MAIAAALAAAGCPSGPPASTAPSASAASAAPSASAAFPVPPEVVAKELNPTGAAAYSGKGGVVRGVVRAIGPASPPSDPRHLARIGDDCAPAREHYAKLFREGAQRELADVLVAVTGYQAFVPATEPAAKVVARDCAFEKRTVAAVFGQRLDVGARGARPYMPSLVGARAGVMMVALPNGDPVGLYPDRVGRLLLTDHALPFMRADVFVLRYSTTAVTGLDGRFEIRGVPPGSLRLSALLPVTMQSVERTIEVIEGAVVDQDLELHAAAPAAGASSAPSTSSAPPPPGGSAPAVAHRPR